MELPAIDEVAALVHDEWIAHKLTNGITSRLAAEDGEELMVPFAQLSEQAKNLDRMLVQSVYNAINIIQ